MIKRILEFLASTAMSGLLIIVPLLIMYLIVTELLDAIEGLATTVTSVLPENFLGPLDEHLIVAVLMVFSGSFLVGLTLRSEFMKNVGSRLEQATVGRLAIWVVVKRLSRGLLGEVEGSAFQTGLLTVSPGSRQLVYIVEDYGNGFLTVFVPISPMAVSGAILLVEEQKVQKLSRSIGDVGAVVGQMGVGVQSTLLDNVSEKI